MAASTDKLKGQLTNQQNAPQKQPQSAQQQVKAYLQKIAPDLQQVAPKHFNIERVQRIVISEFRKNPALQDCNLPSFIAAVTESAKLGLEPGILGHCYFIPFNNRKEQTKDVQFMIGYKGLIELVQRSGKIQSIMAREVHDNDHFEIMYGLDEKLEHIPNMEEEPGEVTKYYAVAKFKDGGHAFIVKSKKQIEAHRDKFSKTSKYGPWVDNFDEMAKKTVLKMLIKYLPISIEVQENVQEDERVRKDITDEGKTPDYIDMESSEEDNDNQDQQETLV